jgi:hypothetical protein
MDIVVSRAAEMRTALLAAADVPYSEPSGRAYSMLMATDWGWEHALPFVTTLGWMQHYRDQILGLEPFYRERLASLRTVVNKLGGFASQPQATAKPGAP